MTNIQNTLECNRHYNKIISYEVNGKFNEFLKCKLYEKTW